MAHTVPTAETPELATILLDQPTRLGFRQGMMIMMVTVVSIVQRTARMVVVPHRARLAAARDGGTHLVAIIGMHIDHHLVRTMEKKQE